MKRLRKTEMRDSYYIKPIFLLVSIILIHGKDHDAPILDIDNQSSGYLGRISEHSVLVDLMPHLQIKNIESINGICSYHVFKPNNEEFPFTVEIKDKSTGEAVIELIRKQLNKNKNSEDSKIDLPNAKGSAKSVLLDCNKRKEFDFLIQAHDCSMPSLYSNKVPVRIEVLDSDDYLLQFDQPEYSSKLIKSANLYENFISVKARDNDCTNSGIACSYTLEHTDYLDEDFPFKIDTDGQISSTQGITQNRNYNFKVRAYDCVKKSSFVETNVDISIVEPCTPKWTDFPKEIVCIAKSTILFEQINSVSCDDQTSFENMNKDDNSVCHIDSATSKLELVLEPTIENKCESVDCVKTEIDTVVEKKSVIFSANKINAADDSIEDDYYDQNKINSDSENGINLQAPLNYRSFSKLIENAQKINFDGRFGNKFNLNVWLRRPAKADQKVKEQVFCGSDTLAMNRHHFGLYFYRGSIKFLMRKENSEENQQDVFYPSLWEWSLPDRILNDNNWHFYEIKINYPTAMLYIDGVHFIENKTNSDIIDAYELADSASNSDAVTSYVGACYHARTNSLVDHFEGDIGSVVITKLQNEEKNGKECKKKCHEAIEMNMVGNENFLNSIEHVNAQEIRIHTSNLKEMSQILQRINYINTDSYTKDGSRIIKLTTTVHCSNDGKQISMGELTFPVNVKHQIREYNVQMEGDKTLIVSKFELENGVEPFRDISIYSYEINKIDKVSDETEKGNDILLSQCHIKITPERNTMTPTENYEKVMFLQNLLDEYKFEFKETSDSVVISGVQKAENYQSFIRRLTYVITNVKDIDDTRFIQEKQFYVSCVRNNPNIETNTIIVQLNIIQNENKLEKKMGNHRLSFVAHKQAQRLVVSENDDSIFLDKMHIPHSYKLKSTAHTSPMLVLLVAMCVCGMGFFLVFGAIRINSSFFGNKRSKVPNEENPNMECGMEWDDSGLNITENPLDKLESKKDSMANLDDEIIQNDCEYDEEYTSNEDDDDEYDQYEDQYTSEEENGGPGLTDRAGLEWDDASIGIKMNKKNHQNSDLDSNKFV